MASGGGHSRTNSPLRVRPGWSGPPDTAPPPGASLSTRTATARRRSRSPWARPRRRSDQYCRSVTGPRLDEQVARPTVLAAVGLRYRSPARPRKVWTTSSLRWSPAAPKVAEHRADSRDQPPPFGEHDHTTGPGHLQAESVGGSADWSIVEDDEGAGGEFQCQKDRLPLAFPTVPARRAADVPLPTLGDGSTAGGIPRLPRRGRRPAPPPLARRLAAPPPRRRADAADRAGEWPRGGSGGCCC